MGSWKPDKIQSFSDLIQNSKTTCNENYIKKTKNTAKTPRKQPKAEIKTHKAIKSYQIGGRGAGLDLLLLNHIGGNRENGGGSAGDRRNPHINRKELRRGRGA